MQFVGQITSTVYDRIESQATNLRCAVASAGNKAVALKDAAYIAVEDRAIVLRDVVTTTGEKAQKLIVENTMVVRVQKTSLAFVDTLDMLIDRYLPDPEAKDEKDGTKVRTTEALIPRMLRIPLKIPARTIQIAVVRARDGYDLLQVKIKWSIKLTREQKDKLKDIILTKSRAIADQASSSSLAVALRQGKHDTSQKVQALLQSIDAGKKVLGAKCHYVCERFYIIEVRDWTLKKVDSTMVVASNTLTGVSQRVYDVTSLIGGHERAKGIFTVAGKRLPFVMNAIRERSASTGSLSDASSTDGSDQKIASSTGTTVKTKEAEPKSDKEADA